MGIIRRDGKAINERYRPLRFSEMIGNDPIKASLGKWMASKPDNRNHSLLLYGDMGSAKTTTARILAMGLNCERGDTVEPCLECGSCREILTNSAMHVSELNMGALNKKEDADAIINSLWDTCLTGRNRVFILDESHCLTRQSQNLMLKAVENPPKGTYIIFCTTEADKFLPTLVNRCEKYNFHLPNSKERAQLFKEVLEWEKFEMTAEAKKTIFERTEGRSYRECLIMIEQFMNGGEGALSDINVGENSDAWKICIKIEQSNFKVASDMVMNDENFDSKKAEDFRRMARVFFMKKLLAAGMSAKGVNYFNVLKVFDNGQPYGALNANPKPSLIKDIFEACALMSD